MLPGCAAQAHGHILAVDVIDLARAARFHEGIQEGLQRADRQVGGGLRCSITPNALRRTTPMACSG